MYSIPSYALYGEAEADREQDWLHCETIQARSRLHDYRIAPHRHEQLFQVLRLTGGSATVTIDGSSSHLAPPAIVVVPALTVHGYVFSPDVEGIVVTLMDRDVRAAGAGDIGPAVLADAGAVGRALDDLTAEADRPGPAHGIAMRALVALLAVAILRSRPAAMERNEAVDRSVTHARAFRHLVDRSFRRTRRIDAYADQLGISHTHLNRVSREVLGTSALGVIERRVALEARRMLQFSTLPIKQIGAELGYDDPAYFTRVMTRVLGISPAAYRRRARG